MGFQLDPFRVRSRKADIVILSSFFNGVILSAGVADFATPESKDRYTSNIPPLRGSAQRRAFTASLPALVIFDVLLEILVSFAKLPLQLPQLLGGLLE